MDRVWTRILSQYEIKSKKTVEILKHLMYHNIGYTNMYYKRNKEARLMLYKAIDLSKYIVTKCVADACPISNLHLQKILYYIQKDFLKRGSVAFADEIEAWQFGPVVPNVYYKYCGFGAMPITNTYDDVKNLIDSCDLNSINAIVEEKRCLDPWDLVADTHKPGGAWAQVYKDGEGNHDVISHDLIKQED